MNGLHQLRIFLKVAETGSVSKAAGQMRIGQPAMSRQIRLLEEEIGAVLFTRESRGMKLTRAGEALRRTVARAIGDLEQAFTDVRSRAQTPRGKVRVGLVSTIGFVAAGPLAKRITTQFPDIALSVCDGQSFHLLEWLHRGDLDLAVVCGTAVDAHLNVQPLLVEELVLAGPASGDLTPDRSVTFDDVAAMRLVLPSTPNATRQIVERAAGKARIQMQVAAEGDSLMMVARLVDAEVGNAIIPLSALRYLQQTGYPGLKYAPIRGPRLTKQLVLVRLGDGEPPHAVGIVHKLLVEEITAAVRSGILHGAHLMTPLTAPPPEPAMPN